MDVEKTISLLQKKKAQALIEDPHSEIGRAFNDGIETMLNYAIACVYQISNEREEA